MTPRSPFFVAAALALLSIAALAQTPPPSDPALEVKRDPRLGRPIMLRSEGMYVSHVLRRLSAKTGVALSVSGQAGDERLIAFVPEAPLAEVLASIADLYNLKWVRESKDGKLNYRLFKPLARIREEALLKEKALQEGLVELDRQANEPPKAQRLQEPHYLALRSAAVAVARANWQKIVSEAGLDLFLKDLPVELRETAMGHAKALLEKSQQEVYESERRLRDSILEKGGKLPAGYEKEPQPRPLGDPSTWRLVYELKINAGIELTSTLWCDGFGSRIFNGHAKQGEAEGFSLYRDRNPRPSQPPAQDPAPPQSDPFSKPLFAVNGPPIKPSHLSNPWLTALENLPEMGPFAVYSDDYSNPESGGRQRRADPPANGETAQAFLDRLCPQDYDMPRCFWWRRGSTALIRSRGYLNESDSVIPASLTEQMVSRQAQSRKSLLQAVDLLELSRLTMRQLNGIINSSGEREGWRRTIAIPARLGPQSQALAVGGGLRWELMSQAEQALAQQLSRGGRAVGPGYAAKVSASSSHASWRSRSAIAIRMETDLTPGSGYGISLPAPQLNPQGLIVVDASTMKAPRGAGERLVFAKYYPWYGLESVSGQQRKVKLGREKVTNFAHYPASGPYDSSDEATMRRHVEQLKSAGVDVLECNWPGADTFEDKALKKLAPIAKAQGLRVCLMLEEIKRQPLVALAASLSKTVKELGDSFLKVEGRPVVFVREPARDLYTHQEWADLIELLGKTASPGFLLVAAAHGPTESVVFSGSIINAGVSWSEEETPLSVAATLRVRGVESAALIRRRNRICVAQVTPGIDFRHLSGGEAQIDRINGAFYKALWSAATDYGADWVVIDSFNQWEIGTEIEPSREFGDLYLKLTAEQAALFKARK